MHLFGHISIMITTSNSPVKGSGFRQLVGTGLEKHLQLEYKSELYDGNDRGNKEFLLDICMFANAGGGILLLGIEERRDAQGQPTGSPDPNAQIGIDIPNTELVLQAYDARAVAAIEDRLPLESFAIPVADARHVFAIRVPNSMATPHCVRYQGHVYFPSRRERHRYEMDIREIKEMVMRTASRLEESTQKLLASFSEMPQQDDAPYLLIGIIPVFGRDFLLDVRNEAIIRAVGMFDLSNQNFVQPMSLSVAARYPRPSKECCLSTNASERDSALAEHCKRERHHIDVVRSDDSRALRFRFHSFSSSGPHSGRCRVGRSIGYAAGFRSNLRAHRLGHAAQSAKS